MLSQSGTVLLQALLLKLAVFCVVMVFLCSVCVCAVYRWQITGANLHINVEAVLIISTQLCCVCVCILVNTFLTFTLMCGAGTDILVHLILFLLEFHF